MDSRQTYRVQFHNTLTALCNNVYFQPPATISLIYPCIVYKRSTIDNRFADNDTYMQNVEYEVTVIDKNPDSSLIYNVSKLPKCKHIRSFSSDGLNHDVFHINY